MTELMKRLVDAGYPREEMYHHYTDLYVYVNEISRPYNRAVVRGAWMARGLDVPHLPGPDHGQADVRLRIPVCGGGLNKWRSSNRSWKTSWKAATGELPFSERSGSK